MMKLSFSAVSHIGELKAINDDRVYASGKFTGFQEMDNVQLSYEDRDKQFIFAVSEGMESDEEDGSPEISATGELLKFQKKVRSSIKDVENKVEEMYDCIEQLNNLLYSMTIGNENKKDSKPSFAGLIIDNGKAAAINLGNCRSYKLEPDNLRPVVNDYKRTERLLKMGIITDEQAEFLANQQGTIRSESLTQVKKSEVFKIRENDVFLICSNGLIDAVNEENIHEILSSESGTDEIASLLVKRAVENGAKDNVTAAVIRVLSMDEENAAARSASQNLAGRFNKFTGTVGNKRIDKSRIISAAVMVIVAVAVVFGTYTLVSSLISGDKGKVTADAGIDMTSESTGINSSKATTNDESTTEQTDGTDAAAGNTGETEDANDGTATTYTIKKGDSLFTISKKFYGDTQKYKIIMEANGIKDANKIRAGQEIKIPALK